MATIEALCGDVRSKDSQADWLGYGSRLQDYLFQQAGPKPTIPG